MLSFTLLRVACGWFIYLMRLVVFSNYYFYICQIQVQLYMIQQNKHSEI